MTDTTLPIDDPHAFLAAHPDTQIVDLLMPDLCGVMRGKKIPATDLPKLYTHGVGFPASLFANDITGRGIDETGLVWETGDADLTCKPVPGTLVPVPWADRPTAQVLLRMLNDDRTPFDVDPRTVLERAVERLAALGYQATVAIELEFYFLDADWGPEDRPRPPMGPLSGFRHTNPQVYGMDDLNDFDGVLSAIDAACRVQNIPADAAIAEVSPGQFEINLRHVPNPIDAADDAVMFKRVVRAVAADHDIDATFMAKPYGTEAGCGMHVHISLRDQDGNLVFEAPDDDPMGSPLLHHAIGGLIRTMPDSMAIFAPNANSYRRFLPDSYAPNAPTWGINNRTVALRIPAGPPGSRRVEHRVPGADANPHLVVAALLAGIVHGIEQKIDPGPITTGNAYSGKQEELPTSWHGALEAFAASTVLRDTMGDRFSDIFLTVKRAERMRFQAIVTDIEFDWYLRTA